MNEQELLAVLDMSEDEQWEWCVKNVKEKTMGESLADLAFRLRDEVCKISCENYYAALETVYCNRVVVSNRQCCGFYAYQMYQILTIDMIMSALISKEK